MSRFQELPPLEQSVLQSARLNLIRRYRDEFDEETLDEFLLSSFEQLAGSATVGSFLPLLAERFARQRLDAMLRVKHRDADAPPIVLFLCVHNAGRSQMALGWFNHLAQGKAIAWSGGSEPGSQVNPAAVEAMKEIGIDITQEFPKPWTDEIVQAADVVVTMGCGDTCPYFPGKRYEDWVLEDPADLTVDDVRPIRDEIGRRVDALLQEVLPV